MFNQDGSLATGVLTGEYACLDCHVDIRTKFEDKGKPEKAIQWARKSTKKIH